MSHSNTNIKVFVIHVRDQEERKRFIEPQLKALGIPYEYILDGNMEDLTPEVIDRYFAVGGEADTMHGVYPRTSCTYKAFLAYKRIVDDRLDGALIFEDDIQLFSDFRQKFEDTLDEINRTHQHTPLLANYEESSLLLVPRSIRRKGQYLYEMPRDRFAGCYYINNEAAQVIIDYLKEYKCNRPLDRFHTTLVEKGLIHYFWSYPCLAVQRSCNATVPTLIPTKPRPLKRLKWIYKRFYKHLLYWFR